jgi:hypothetical protein
MSRIASQRCLLKLLLSLMIFFQSSGFSFVLNCWSYSSTNTIDNFFNLIRAQLAVYLLLRHYLPDGLGRRRSFGAPAAWSTRREQERRSLTPVIALLWRGLARPFVGAAVILMAVSSWRQRTAGERRTAAGLLETEERRFQFDFQFADLI